MLLTCSGLLLLPQGMQAGRLPSQGMVPALVVALAQEGLGTVGNPQEGVGHQCTTQQLRLGVWLLVTRHHRHALGAAGATAAAALLHGQAGLPGTAEERGGSSRSPALLPSSSRTRSSSRRSWAAAWAILQHRPCLLAWTSLLLLGGLVGTPLLLLLLQGQVVLLTRMEVLCPLGPLVP